MTKQKFALIIGGSDSVGTAVVSELVSRDYSVLVVVGIGEADALSGLNLGPEGTVVELDLADRSATTSFGADLKPDQALDAVVINASHFEFENFASPDYSEWDKTFEVNLNAPLVLAHAVKDRLTEGAAIVSITTTDALAGAYASAGWAASKAALISLTRSLANNLGSRGIRANAVAVGWLGNLEELGDADVQRESVDITPLGRLGDAGEVASVVSFLLSDGASFVSGTTVVVDGGYTAVDVIGKKEAQGL